MKNLLTAKEVGERLNVSRDTVKDAARLMGLDVFKSGVRGDWGFTEQDVEKLRSHVSKVRKQ